jgi:DNA polymerase I-like protein with 3'-5' exonuclease and polymerase domains
MKVIYKPYMVKAINTARMKAAEQCREIEKIKVTGEEWEQLKSELAQNMNPEEWYRRFMRENQTVPTYIEAFGIRIEREGL